MWLAHAFDCCREAHGHCETHTVLLRTGQERLRVRVRVCREKQTKTETETRRDGGTRETLRAVWRARQTRFIVNSIEPWGTPCNLCSCRPFPMQSSKFSESCPRISSGIISL